MKETISIMGCGWLGQPLAVELLAAGYDVKGSTTTSEKMEVLEKHGVEPFFIILDPFLRSRNIRSFLDTDVLIINIPPPRDRPDTVNYHLEQVRSVLMEVDKARVRKIIFISSTSVYGDREGVITENDVPAPAKPSGKALVRVEQELLKQENISVTILRCGGLIGEDRNPVKYMSGREVKDGDATVNLIHRKDCINIIKEILRQGSWGGIYNVVADGHPVKKDFYTAAAHAKGIASPIFSKGGSKRIISNQKIKQHLRYDMIYSDPMDMLR